MALFIFLGSGSWRAAAAPCEPLPLSAEVQESGGLTYQERAPEGGDPKAPIVIALHGLGHHKRGFSRLAERLPRRWRVISVDAPWRYGRGYAWYRYRCPQAHEDLKRATALLIELTRALIRRYPAAPKPAVFGFSQGGVMSLSALNTAPSLWSAIGSLSGYWLPKARPGAAAPKAPALYMAHGLNDRVVPYQRGLEAAESFGQSGFNVAWLPFEGRHEVSAEALRGLRELFEGAFKAQRSAVQADTSPAAPQP